MLMVQQCAGQRGQRPAQAEIALGNKGLTLYWRLHFWIFEFALLDL